MPAAATYRCNIILLCVQRNVIKIDDTFVHYFVCSQILTSPEQRVIVLLVIYFSIFLIIFVEIRLTIIYLRSVSQVIMLCSESFSVSSRVWLSLTFSWLRPAMVIRRTY